MKKSALKKVIAAVVAASLATIAFAGLAGCSSSSNDNSASNSAASSINDTVIRVGASPTPHAEILEAMKPAVEEQGFSLEVVEYNDYVLPNTALEDGELDANYFQHITYLNDFNEENGTHLVDVASVHFEPLGLYSSTIESIDQVEDGAVVVVPNDPTNEARALLLLQDQGLITVDENAGLSATVLDIVENPHNLVIQEVEAAQVPRSMDSATIVAVNGNYALNAGLNVEDAIAVESTDADAATAYANVLAVKDGNQNDAKTQALVQAILSPTVAEFIEQNYGGAVVAVF